MVGTCVGEFVRSGQLVILTEPFLAFSSTSARSAFARTTVE